MVSERLRGRPRGSRPTGRALAELKFRRYQTLVREGFTDGEINVYGDRRISSRGLLKLRRERKRELKGLTPAEIVEWREQMYEAYDEATAADNLRRVSPGEW